jgi:hypothetical protein
MIAYCAGNPTDSRTNKKTMKKNYLAIALLALTTLAHANTCTVFNTITVNNASQNCDLTTTLTGVSGVDVTGCSFNFNNCTSTSWGSHLLYCTIGNTTIGTLSQTASTWSCDLNSTGLTLLNNCITGGTTCYFGVTCQGGWNIGGCTASYTCTPHPHTAPDAASTAMLLSFGLAGASLLRRKLA